MSLFNSFLPSPEISLVPHIPWEGRTFLDIGANDGSWTALLAPGYEKVYAFEPHPEAVRRFMENLGMTRDRMQIMAAGGKIKIIATALWNEDTPLTLHTFWHNTRTSAIFSEHSFGSMEGRGTLNVTAIRLDTLHLENIDFIKIDVEGAEPQVLQGAMETLEREMPRVIVEVHSAEGGVLCAQRLSYLGYRLIHVEPVSVPGGEDYRGNYYHIVAYPSHRE